MGRATTGLEDLFVGAAPEGVTLPTLATLRRYGLTSVEWLAILESQGWLCAICRRVPKSGRWVTDHEHVARWKKLAPADRRRYVRGIICPFCNSHVCGRFVTLDKARNLVGYLERYNERRPVETVKPSRKVKKRRGRR